MRIAFKTQQDILLTNLADGHYIPSGPRSRNSQTKRTYINVNDGRAPDNHEMLSTALLPSSQVGPPRTHTALPAAAARAPSVKSANQDRAATWVRAEGTAPVVRMTPAQDLTAVASQAILAGALTAPLSDPFPNSAGLFTPAFLTSGPVLARSLQSYIWNNMSCYHDVGEELWFRAFSRWSADKRTYFLTLLATTFKERSGQRKDPLIYGMFYHFQSRIKWILLRSKDTAAPESFKHAQNKVRDVICRRWELVPPGHPGCAITWLNRTVKVRLSENILSCTN